MVQHNDLVCKANRHLFSLQDIAGAHTTLPLSARPVQPVNRHDYPFAEQVRDPAKKCRTFGVDMNYVIVSQRSCQTGKKAGGHRCQALDVDGRHIFDADSFKLRTTLGCMLLAADVLPGAIVAGNRVPQLNHPRGKLLHHDLDTTFV